MAWFSRKNVTAQGSTDVGIPVRMHSALLTSEPSMTALAKDCAEAAGPGHAGELSNVLTAIYTYVTSEVRRSFTALHRPEAGDGFEALYALPGFNEQMLWDYLTGDSGKIAVHNHLAEQLESEPVRDALIQGIRAGNYSSAVGQPHNDSTAVAGEEAVGQTSLSDPGLEQADPRQLLHTLVSNSGLSFVLSAQLPVEEILERAVQIAPALSDSQPLGRGFFRLNRDPETTWAAVEGPHGAAVVVACAPGSDSGVIHDAITIPFHNAPQPLSMGMVHLGSSSQNVIQVLAGGDIVPAWEAKSFAHLRAESKGWVTLPPAARRAARSWERLGLDLYKRIVTDIDGDTNSVFFGIFGDRVLLFLAIGPSAEDSGQLQGLDGMGPYRLEHIEGFHALVRPIPANVSAAQLEEFSQSIADDFAVGLARLRRATASVTPVLPLEPDGTPLWARLESYSSESTKLRPFRWPALALYTTTERVRESVPDDQSTFDSINTLAHHLKAKRGAGFEYSWRTSGDAPISPTWLTVTSASYDPMTGRAVASARFTHEVWALPPAHDLGAIDGRNATFSENGHPGGLYWPPSSLYVGSARSGVFLPLDATANVLAVDLHGETGTIGTLEHLGGSTGAVALYDQDGRRRLLTVIDGIAGNEPLRFSGDGSWLLITASRTSTIVEVSTGRSLQLNVANTAWWSFKESSLLTIEHEGGRIVPKVFNLATNTYTETFSDVTLDVPMLTDYPYLWFPSVSPNGREVLALTPTGVTDEYQREHGTGDRVARVNLVDGKGKLLNETYFNTERSLERDVREVRWTGRLTAHPVELHPDLAAELRDPVTVHEYLSPGRWADEVEGILVSTLNRAIELTKAGQPMHYLLPEILATLIPVAKTPEVWARQAEWLISVQQGTYNLADGPSAQGNASAWRAFGSAIAAIQAGRPDLIDPLVATV